MKDIIIIGAGPAGLTAAIYACRAGKSVLVIEKGGFGGQVTYSPKIENFPGSIEMSGMEFADRLVEQALALGAETEIAEAEKIISEPDRKVILCADGERFEGGAVILATGAKHRMLGLENEENLIGSGISFCAVCDGDFFKDRPVAVVGGGNSALQEALLLSETSSHVHVLQNLAGFTGESTTAELLMKKPNVTCRFNTVVTKLLGTDSLTGLLIHNTQTGEDSRLDVDAMFTAIGLVPETEAFADIAKVNAWGYFDSDERCLTATPGVFVAGDCRAKTVRQITTACADGSIAALAACDYLNR